MSTVARSLGKYRLIALLAQGGMGDVWLAFQHGPAGFNKLVVLKELPDAFLEDVSSLTMFLDEARICARLNHPHVVQTYEIGEDKGAYFIAMEFLDGHSLQRLRYRARERGHPLSLAHELPVLMATLRALEYAHELVDYDGTPLRLVHRDVSPHNVLITFDGQAKLLDFGIAKALDSKHETRSGTVKGKLPYMSPEQALGDNVDQRADIFAVGVMLAEALTGRRFWPRMPQQQMFAHLVRGSLPDYRAQARPAPAELFAICDKAIAFDPAARYQSAAEMRDDLQATIDRHPELRGGIDTTATVLADLFADERERVRACIDAGIRAFRPGQNIDSPATAFEVVSLAGIHPESTSVPTPTSVPLPEHDHPSLAPLSATMRPPRLPQETALTETAVEPLAAPAPPKTAMLAAAAIAGGALLGGVLYVVGHPRETIAPAAAAWPSTPPAPERLDSPVLDAGPPTAPAQKR
jgi:eukaryotic-like serine/threonine-protein kinase